MSKFSAIVLAIGLSVGIAGVSQAESFPRDVQGTDWNATDVDECPALKAVGNGKFDCLDQGESTAGRFHFMTWENNGSKIVRGYPLFDGKQFVRIDSPTNYAICQDMVNLVWNRPDFQKYDEIWCVKEGE